MEVVIKDELINFILPLEDLEDISKIIEMKNRIEELNIKSLVNKYNISNYVFALLEYNNKISKSISYKVKNINDELALNSILKDLKLKITDFWKEENLINTLMRLSIEL